MKSYPCPVPVTYGLEAWAYARAWRTVRRLVAAQPGATAADVLAVLADRYGTALVMADRVRAVRAGPPEEPPHLRPEAA